MTESVLLVSDATMVGHDPGPQHPEQPARLRAVLNELRDRPVTGAQWGQPAPAPRSAIERVHDPSYIDLVEGTRGRHVQLDPDTRTSPRSVDTAYWAAGTTMTAVSAVLDGSAKRSFALTRPPGHHAERNAAMGFCLFNSIAVAAAHAREALGCRRILILDWDVHHGNGTQHAFEDQADILFIDSHQSPLYPGTGDLAEMGTGAGTGFTVNLPLPPETQDRDIVAVYQSIVVPIADQFKPDLVMCSAGFDGHIDDPLAGLSLTETGYAALCGIACDLADRHADGRVILALEGGYHLQALARSVRACVEVLAGATPPQIEKPAAAGEALVTRFRLHHGQNWAL